MANRQFLDFHKDEDLNKETIALMKVNKLKTRWFGSPKLSPFTGKLNRTSLIH
jgi:hypothetical protein